jgi:hypothetical protein
MSSKNVYIFEFIAKTAIRNVFLMNKVRETLRNSNFTRKRLLRNYKLVENKKVPNNRDF